METLSKINFKSQPVLPLSSLHRTSFSQPISSISFKTPFRPPHPSRSSISFRVHAASSSPLSSSNRSNSAERKTPAKPFPQLFSLIKIPVCVTIAAAAIFLSRFSHKPLIAYAVAAPKVEKASTASESTSSKEDAITEEEKEKACEEYLASNPDSIEALKALMEVKLKSRKLLEAIDVVNKLIQLQPEEVEWPMLRAHMFIYAGETELAKAGFEEIIAKDKLRVEAYHGLIMAVSQGEAEADDAKELGELVKRVEAATEECKKEKRKDDVRDFKLLTAQIRVIEGNYNEALRVYQELVKEEPRDFRPYLCQGIIYTLLKKKDEAEKYFEKYKRLVPKGHPYADYFNENMLATKVFSQRAEAQGMGAAGMKS